MTEQEKLRLEFDGYLDIILTEAKRSFDIRHVGKKIINDLSKFNLYSKQQNVQFLDSWIIQKDRTGFTLSCIEIDSVLALPGKFTSLYNIQAHKFLLGYLRTRDDFGNSFIRPETIPDKLTEIFQPNEVDFDNHPQFSGKYYCLTNDTYKFRKAMTLELMNVLAFVSPLEIEFLGNQCLFKQTKSIIDIKGSLKFISTGIELAKNLNPGNINLNCLNIFNLTYIFILACITPEKQNKQ